LLFNIPRRTMAACTKEIYWYYYIVVSLVTFFGGLIVLVPARFIWYALHNKSTNKQSWTEKHTEFHCFSRMRAQAANILSGHGKFSKAMVSVILSILCVMFKIVYYNTVFLLSLRRCVRYVLFKMIEAAIHFVFECTH
jgi:hypothetical protein